MKMCVFVDERLVLKEGESRLPTADEVQAWGIGGMEGVEVSHGPHRAQAVNGPAGHALPPGTLSVSLRGTLGLIPDPDLSLALTAAHMLRWRRTSRFCGVCGMSNQLSPSHNAMECADCGHMSFPKVSPAVIVQVRKGDHLLLGRSKRHPPGF